MKLVMLPFILLSFLSSDLYGAVGKLKPNEIEKLKQGGFVVQEKEQPNAPWPERVVFHLIEARPEEAMAVFAAYEYQKEYVPNLIQSKVIRHMGPLKTVVEYEMSVPWPLGNAKYQQSHELQKRGPSYLLYWRQVRSNKTDVNTGNVVYRPAPFGPNKTLMVYTSFIRPKSVFAEMVESRSKNDLMKSLKAIVKHTLYLKKNAPNKLKGLTQTLRKSFNGIEVYQ